MGRGNFFDRTFLPEADLEFVVLADTHFMGDTGRRQIEFESRRLQTERIERALVLVESLKVDFVIHLGDLTQDYPGGEDFGRSLDLALEQLKRFPLNWHFVAGNHDVGDKLDPTMPTEWVSAESIINYHDRVGPSWYSWDHQNYHFVAINSQILNSNLPEEAVQDQWLEEDLAAHKGSRIFMFMHLPLYLNTETEQALGHYDNIAQPARGRVIELIKKYGVEFVFAGHSHFPFFDRLGSARYFVAASPSFTRPGFGEVFSSCPPPERGRNDESKLGFYLVRTSAGKTEVHFIRTYGDTKPATSEPNGIIMLSRRSLEMSGSPLGLSLRHPLARQGEVPIAFPSAIRQKVRDDCRALAITELGARQLRIPAADFQDSFQRQRLAVLRKEGVSLVAVWLWSPGLDLASEASSVRNLIDGVEVQLCSAIRPERECLEQIDRLSAETGLSITLSTLVPNQRVWGKQHNRPRSGFLASELPDLEAYLAKRQNPVDRVLCRLESGSAIWEAVVSSVSTSVTDQLWPIDWLFELQTTDQSEQSSLSAEALFAMAVVKNNRLFVEPFSDLDRTMDASFGLLDRLSNPRPAFNVIRCLNSILFSGADEYRPWTSDDLDGIRVLGLDGRLRRVLLLLPDWSKAVESTASVSVVKALLDTSNEIEWYELEKGFRRRHTSAVEGGREEVFPLPGPVLVSVAREKPRGGS